MFHSSEAPGEFPNTHVLPFRVSLYAETSGLWSRLLAIVLDSCRLRIRTNHLALSMLMESNRRQIEQESKKTMGMLIGGEEDEEEEVEEDVEGEEEEGETKGVAKEIVVEKNALFV